MGTPNWVNRTIWTGDNLHILRGMNSESVDLIYLDPPFNSNRNYAAPIGSKAAGAAFKDTWYLSDLDKAWMGLIADTEPALYQVVYTAGLAHSNHTQSYLCMMAVRLTEMKRVLKPTGSIYLHCDPKASHYLKLLMDVVFGRQNYRNEIVWCYTGPGSPGMKQFNRKHDTILWYSRGDTWVFNKDSVRLRHNPKTVGNYKEGLIGSGHADTPLKPGKVAESWWMEEKGNGFSITAKQKRQYVGYPTQKPLALLDRIILASSNEGDMVLDPFCGCATACVSAETHLRQWAGIDLSEKAVELVEHRLRDHHGLFGDIIHRTDIPQQEGVLDVMYKNRETKHILFGEQEGQCNGCKYSFDYRHFEVDHVVPQSKGGGSYRQPATALWSLQQDQGRPPYGVSCRPSERKRVSVYANSAFMKESHG